MSMSTQANRIHTLTAAFFVVCVLLFPLFVDAAPATFERAKIELRQKVYHDRNKGAGGDLYCGCDWNWVGRSGGRIDASSCGAEVRAQPHRAARTEFEHIVASSSFGRQRQCWQQGGRSNCQATDPVFNVMEADMFNLSVVQGELNSDRSNFNFGVLPHAPLQHGSCPFKVDFKQRSAEPLSGAAKGLVARTSFYFHDRYNLTMSRQQQQLFMAWHKQHPATSWELERNRRITRIMGHTNKYTTGERTWTLGNKPSGDGLAKLPMTNGSPQPARQESQRGTPLLVASNGQLIIGNQRSKIYHLPEGCPNYDMVSPNNQVHFDSTAAAEAAGFRIAGNCD